MKPERPWPPPPAQPLPRPGPGRNLDADYRPIVAGPRVAFDAADFAAAATAERSLAEASERQLATVTAERDRLRAALRTIAVAGCSCDTAHRAMESKCPACTARAALPPAGAAVIVPRRATAR
jgi:hypothetical protein